MGLRALGSTPSEALGLVGFFQEDLEGRARVSWAAVLGPGVLAARANSPPCPTPHLTQNDPHRGVCLDGEAQGFQRPKGRVYLALRHTLVEGAWGGATLSEVPRSLPTQAVSPLPSANPTLTNLKVAVRAPWVPQGGCAALL